jgi:AcrR family transcriptional regulator
MTSPDTRNSIFGPLAVLPRGPHRLTRAEVADSQRARLMAAAAELLGEKGYASTTITEIARRANVSPNQFYGHFRDKEDCVLAAYDVFIEALMTRMASELAPTNDWGQFVLAAIHGYFASIEEEPTIARAFLIEMDAAGPIARSRRHAALAAIAAQFKQQHAEIRRQDPSLGPLPDAVYLGLVYAVRDLVCDALEGSPPTPLHDLESDVLYWITAMIEGAASAGQDANVRATRA